MAITGFATIENVRDLVGLPNAEKLPDLKIVEHLASAKLKVDELIGDYSSFIGNDRARVKEAECCFTAYYGLISWNTFFTSNIENFQKEVGEMDAQFFAPDQVEQYRKYWYERATDRLNIFINENEDLPIMSWNAI